MEWNGTVSKPVSKGGEESWCIEQKDDTDMRATSTQSLESGILRKNSKHSTKYKGIGDDDKHHI
jgi:hypothetical protein